MILKITYILFLFLFACFSVSAQSLLDENPDVKQIFHKTLKNEDLEYRLPNGYNETFKDINARMGVIFLSASMCQLQTNDDSILLYITIQHIDTTKAMYNKLKSWGLEFDVNESYLNLNTDTIKHPIIHFSAGYSRRKFNAHDSGMFELEYPLQYAYRGIYTKCKGIFIHKNDMCDIKLYYFYTDKSAVNLKKNIRRSYNILRFKN
ncbi:hypothetical protein CPT03_19120 [Pedobacter ginsengisoli]|uniref:Uncharacterized protein n=1 Tax=Pedobacter ginsengisoli TaxID=363852 RepID=A0A2D1U9Z3_9SPHI|nr:hypothetical protein [Pedobacter ginsengisoli]ATP58422.1 hypothetical protein CPT03_19120 [Pedobacter ginsengisoli]